eukprot:scaffold29539_cov20-Tisochrysis_lutea.AAC.1
MVPWVGPRVSGAMPWIGPLGEMPDGMRRGVASPVHRRRSVVEERKVDSLPGADVPLPLVQSVCFAFLGFYGHTCGCSSIVRIHQKWIIMHLCANL